jgi:hypothetical protein
MKLRLAGTILLLFVCGTIQAADTNQLESESGFVPQPKLSHFPLFVGKQNSSEPVLLMERLESEALRELLPDYTIYRLVSSDNPIHGAWHSALLLETNGVPTHLESDKQVASFLGELTIRRSVDSPTKALQFIRAFAALRSYVIVENQPDFEDVREPEKRPAPLTTDFKFVAEEQENGWRVYATFRTPGYSGKCERYIFTFYRRPGVGISFEDPVVIRLRNYIY